MHPKAYTFMASAWLLADHRGEHLVVHRRYLDHPRCFQLRNTLGALLSEALKNSNSTSA